MSEDCQYSSPACTNPTKLSGTCGTTIDATRKKNMIFFVTQVEKKKEDVVRIWFIY